MSRKSSLPIDALLPAIIGSLQSHRSVIVEAQPGAGKTSRVPPALLDLFPGEILVLEPRRIAARLAARRVAWELGESVGETVGYQVRFEEVSGPCTRLRFVTEGVLTRRFLSDPTLRGVDVVVLDEFHERHIESDFALGLLKRLQSTRPDLRIVLMSATLDATPVARYLDGCPVLRSEGRLFPLEISHLPYAPEALEVQVRKAVELLMRDGDSGDILAFLPGAAEIRRTMRECEEVARRKDILLVPLHGDLAPAEQDRAIEPAARQKLIVATNVAESSITVDGVTSVVDSGLARFATHSPWTGLPTLHVGRVSQASARQRAGRAGRTAPGRVLRLYPEEDFLRRPEHDTPEILRSDLSQVLLSIRAMELDSFDALDWLSEPPQPAIQHAEELLNRLGAAGDMAKRLARYPLSPRLARILVEAIDRGVGEDGCAVAALLSTGARLNGNDILAAIETPQDARTSQHLQQLRRLARLTRQTSHNDDALLMSILAGYPDRVGKVRAGNQVQLASGGSAEIVGAPPAYGFLVAVDIEDRKDKPIPVIRMTARIEPDWLIDLFPERVTERSGVLWNRTAQRVDAFSSIVYDDLTIQETRDATPDPTAAADLLAQQALEVGIEHFVDQQMLHEFMARLEFARIEVTDLSTALREACIGLRSFADLSRACADLIPSLERKTANERLREVAPVSIRLKSGRQVKVHYKTGKPPWVASRLQDFFGMQDTLRIGPDHTPIVVHLLAPNQRAVQTTTDLAGFWQRLYPQVRRELMRRYPRHSWPENP